MERREKGKGKRENRKIKTERVLKSGREELRRRRNEWS